MTFSLKEREILNVFGYTFDTDKVEDQNIDRKDRKGTVEHKTDKKSDPVSTHKKRKSVSVISKKRNV